MIEWITQYLRDECSRSSRLNSMLDPQGCGYHWHVTRTLKPRALVPESNRIQRSFNPLSQRTKPDQWHISRTARSWRLRYVWPRTVRDPDPAPRSRDPQHGHTRMLNLQGTHKDGLQPSHTSREPKYGLEPIVAHVQVIRRTHQS